MLKWVTTYKGQTIKNFGNIDLHPNIIKALHEEGYEKPTEIQKKAIPVILKKADVIGTAQSGTGKTAAFTLPILDELEATVNPENRTIRALILVPTRELASQISKAISHYGRHLDIKHTTVVGGLSHKDQIRKINNGVDILVATPGRLKDHLEKKAINLSSIQTLVLDEADTMLDMGFLEDIELLFANASHHRQVLMFSATLNQNVKKLAKEFLNDPVVIQVHKQRSTVKLINHEIFKVDADKKAEMLSFMIGSKNYNQVLVFVNTKKQADALVEQFNLDGLPSECIHGDIKQPARARALKKFKSGEIRVLIATDIAARGIDIEQLPHVVNYELPETVDDFTHRVGRTGRAGHEGHAITLLCVKEYKFMAEIEKELIINIPRQILDGYEPTEKAPRVVQYRKKSLSEKKGLSQKRKPKEKKQSQSKKTTKRDANRNFRRK